MGPAPEGGEGAPGKAEAAAKRAAKSGDGPDTDVLPAVPLVPADRLPEHPTARRLIEEEEQRHAQGGSDSRPDSRSEQVTHQFRREAGGAAAGPTGARNADRLAYPEALPYPGEPGWKSPDVTGGRGGDHAARSQRPRGETPPPSTPEAPSARPNREKKGLFGRLLSGKEKPRSANSDRIKLPPANSDRIKLPPRRPKPER